MRVMRDSRPPTDLRQSKARIAACPEVRGSASEVEGFASRGEQAMRPGGSTEAAIMRA